MTIHIRRILMRPHHFLCLPGYKGHSYNKEHATSWDTLSKLIASNPNIKVRIVEGEDTLCLKCPNSKKIGGTCDEKTVKEIDEKVKYFLNLENNTLYIFKEIVEKARKLLDPQKHEQLCGDCEWRTKFGLCKDTFKKSET